MNFYLLLLRFRKCENYPSSESILSVFKLLIWTFYTTTPIAAAVTTCLSMDPILPFSKFVLTKLPQLHKILLFFALRSETFLDFYLFVFRLGWATIFIYEGFRVAIFFIALTLLLGKAVISYLSSVSRLTDNIQSDIILRGFKSHLKIYKVLMIIFQSLDAPLKSTISLGIFAGTAAVAGCSFLVVKLHAVNEVYFTWFCVIVCLSVVIWTTIILETFGNLHVTSVKLLYHFRKVEILQEMGGFRRKLYFRELCCLKAITIPFGLGTTRFARMTDKVKTKILVNMFESCINLMVAF